jgi:hypothetical protein
MDAKISNEGGDKPPKMNRLSMAPLAAVEFQEQQNPALTHGARF